MRTVQLGLFRSLKDGLSTRFQQPHLLRTLSTNALPAADGNDEKLFSNFFESANNFERRIFGQSPLENKKTDPFFEKLDRIGKGRDSFGSNWGARRGGKGSNSSDGLDESFKSLQDGTDGRLEKAATSFSFDKLRGDFSFGEDMSFEKGLSNRLDRGGIPRVKFHKRSQSREFEVTTEEALRKADFRNARFLANFVTEGGIIIKRRQTGISAKAQRKIAREIKTARSFGLLPFTTQGTKPFKFGRTMEDCDNDYEYEVFGGMGADMMPTPDTEE